MSRKPKSLYYLLPGQGRGARKRYLRNLVVSIVVGILIAGLYALIWYFIET